MPLIGFFVWLCANFHHSTVHGFVRRTFPVATGFR